jgi:archaellin
MEKSTSVKFSIFIAFVIISSTVTINGSVYAQQSSTTTTPQQQQAISSSNTTAPMAKIQHHILMLKTQSMVRL